MAFFTLIVKLIAFSAYVRSAEFDYGRKLNQILFVNKNIIGLFCTVFKMVPKGAILKIQCKKTVLFNICC